MSEATNRQRAEKIAHDYCRDNHRHPLRLTVLPYSVVDAITAALDEKDGEAKRYNAVLIEDLRVTNISADYHIKRCAELRAKVERLDSELANTVFEIVGDNKDDDFELAVGKPSEFGKLLRSKYNAARRRIKELEEALRLFLLDCKPCSLDHSILNVEHAISVLEGKK